MKGIFLLAAIHILILYQSQKKNTNKKTVIPRPAPVAVGKENAHAPIIYSVVDSRGMKNDRQWNNTSLYNNGKLKREE